MELQDHGEGGLAAMAVFLGDEGDPRVAGREGGRASGQPRQGQEEQAPHAGWTWKVGLSGM
ncbi:MAG: hypothetical protein U1F87_14560 [Kiritimatiellia bacterium]